LVSTAFEELAKNPKGMQIFFLRMTSLLLCIEQTAGK